MPSVSPCPTELWPRVRSKRSRSSGGASRKQEETGLKHPPSMLQKTAAHAARAPLQPSGSGLPTKGKRQRTGGHGPRQAERTEHHQQRMGEGEIA